MKERMNPSTNEEYVCLTYLKGSSWSVGGGQFASGTGIFKSLWIRTFTFGNSWKLSELVKNLTVLCKMAVENSLQKDRRPFQKHEILNLDSQHDYEWSK